MAHRKSLNAAGYALRPEHKSLAPDGDACGPGTAGLLRRRAIESAPELTDLIGKESNRLDERLAGALGGRDDYRNTYGPRTTYWYGLVLPVLIDMGAPRSSPRPGRPAHRCMTSSPAPCRMNATSARMNPPHWSTRDLSSRQEVSRRRTSRARCFGSTRSSPGAPDRGKAVRFLGTTGLGFAPGEDSSLPSRPARSTRSYWSA